MVFFDFKMKHSFEKTCKCFMFSESSPVKIDCTAREAENKVSEIMRSVELKYCLSTVKRIGQIDSQVAIFYNIKKIGLVKTVSPVIYREKKV